MVVHGLIDLDELVLRCRDEHARSYIAEAVACYKAGAFRASIVATWIAVVLDILHKLRELELTGNGAAKVKLEEFERIRSLGEAAVREAQEFERSILDMAAGDFELLTPQEKTDLERLYKDRHRCAHPTMQASDTSYDPPPELARLHIRHAVEILLQREPVQGKNALDRIWAEIKSNYFPRTVDEARQYLESGPLKRARESLVRNVVIGLTKSLLHEERPDLEGERQFAALGATIQMHQAVAESILQRDLPGLLVSVTDNHWHRGIVYLRRVSCSWFAAGEAMQNKARQVVREVSDGTLLHVLADAIHVPGLYQDVLPRLPTLSLDMIDALIEADPRPEYVEVVVARIEKTESYKEIKEIRSSVLGKTYPQLTSNQLKRLVNALTHNSILVRYMGWLTMVGNILDATTERIEEASEEWTRVYSELSKVEHRTGGEKVRIVLKTRIPELPEPTWPEETGGVESPTQEFLL
ncbi:MAG: hypothetical protein WCJ35_05730 [Planctomycetota bacterium]